MEDQDVNWALDRVEGVFDATATVRDVATAVELHVQLAEADRIRTLFDGNNIGGVLREPRREHADPGVGVDDALEATQLRKRDGALIQHVALPRVNLDEGLGTHAEVPAGIVDADRVIVQVQLRDPPGGASTKPGIGRTRWIGRPEQIAGARRPGELQRRHPRCRRILRGPRERRQRPLDRLGVDQTGVDRQGLIRMFSIKAEGDDAATPEDVEFAAEPVAPWIVHPQDVDSIDRKFQVSTLELVMQHLPLLGELLWIRQVLQLTAAASSLAIRAGRLDARGRGVQHRGCLGAPEVFASMGHFGLDRLAGDGSLDEDDPAVDARDRRPAMGELADRELHYLIFSRSSASSRCGLARPLEIFIPWPIRNFKARSFPALKSATLWAFSAMTWPAMASSSGSPLIWLDPFNAVSAGPGSTSRYMTSNVSFAILPLMVPESIN